MKVSKKKIQGDVRLRAGAKGAGEKKHKFTYGKCKGRYGKG